jgi:hypothetical protein
MFDTRGRIVEEKQDKSLLEGMEIKESPSYREAMGKAHVIQEAGINDVDWAVVGHCPKCGCPIYGPKVVPAGRIPTLHKSCTCCV